VFTALTTKPEDRLVKLNSRHPHVSIRKPVFDEDLWCALVLPEQFFSPPSHRNDGKPELALMRAVMEDAVRCYQKQFVSTRRRAVRLAREAEEWFFSDDTEWPYAFLNLCAALEINPEYIRRGLRRWRQHYPMGMPHRKLRVVKSTRTLKLAA
jgi:hypothetical protein